MRKLWFAHLARAIVAFPGGFGTLDELFEMLTLAQTRKLGRRCAILLYGADYWNEIVNFEALVRHGMISPEDLSLFQVRRRPGGGARRAQGRPGGRSGRDRPGTGEIRAAATGERRALMNDRKESQRALLLRVARRALLERGFEADFPAAALAESERTPDPARRPHPGLRDLRAMAWCSIDNDDSRDLDQLTAAETLPDGGARLLVAIADVDALGGPGLGVDTHAAANTTSVYTPPQVFPMLPEQPEHGAHVAGARGGPTGDGRRHGGGRDGRLRRLERLRAPWSTTGRSWRTTASGAWLEGSGPEPAALAAVPGLAENLRLQDGAAASAQGESPLHGALELDTIEVRARFEGEKVGDLVAEERNRAKELIEDFMIAANGVVARFLAEKGSL